MNSECQSVLERLPEVAEGSLKGPESDRAAEHLARCPSCRTALETERRLRRDLSSLPAPGCPESVTDAVMRSIGPGGRPAAAPRRRKIRLRPWGLRPAFAAVLVIALAFAAKEWTRPARRPEPAYSEAELKLAGAALDWSLAFTARTIQESQKQALETVSADMNSSASDVKTLQTTLKSGGTAR